MKQPITAEALMTITVGQNITKGSTTGEVVGFPVRTAAAKSTGKARVIASVRTDYGYSRIVLDADVSVATVK